MNGKIAMGSILGAAVIMGGGLWYSLQFGHYDAVVDLAEVNVSGQAKAVSDYQGLDGESSPLKLRACFNVDWDYPSENAPEATPLKAPAHFTCFDARQISQDLASDQARAFLAQENAPFGFDRYIAQYPDGRAFMWRQINICGERHFAGDAMPAGCPAPDAATAAKRVMIDPDSEIFKLKAISVVSGAPELILVDGDPKIAAASTGEFFHACFNTSSSQAFLSENFELADDAAPVAPRGNFPCFNADQIAADIDTGVAMALIGQRNIIPNTDRMIAIYPDGQAFAWHQKGN